MSQTQMTVSVPSELSNLGKLAQQIVNDLADGKNWMGVLSGAMPVLFQEGMKVDELKAEIKDPSVYVLGGLVAGSVVAKVVQVMIAKKAAQPEAKVVQAPVTVVAPGAGDSSQA